MLDRRVQFLRSELLDTPFGKERGPFEPLGSPVNAARRDVSDVEKFAAGKVQATLDTRFTVRSTPFTRGITPKDHLICEGLEFNIIGVKQTSERRTFLEISCVALVA